MYDVRNFSNLTQLEDHIQTNRFYFNKNKELERKLRHAFTSKKKVIHTRFRCKKFINDLDEFMSYKENKDIDSECH